MLSQPIFYRQIFFDSIRIYENASTFGMMFTVRTVWGWFGINARNFKTIIIYQPPSFAEHTAGLGRSICRDHSTVDARRSFCSACEDVPEKGKFICDCQRFELWKYVYAEPNSPAVYDLIVGYGYYFPNPILLCPYPNPIFCFPLS